MCGLLHLHFESCEHVLESGQLERCQQAYQNNTVCEGDAISKTSVVQYRPGLCPYCAQNEAQEVVESDEVTSEVSDDEDSAEDEDDLTTMHSSEGRSRATSKSASTVKESMLHAHDSRSHGTVRNGRLGQRPVSAHMSSEQSTARSRRSRQQQCESSKEGGATSFHMQYGQPRLNTQAVPGYGYETQPQQNYQPRDSEPGREQHPGDPAGQSCPRSQHAAEPGYVLADPHGHRERTTHPRRHVRQRRKTQPQPVPGPKKTGWLAEKLMNWRVRMQPTNEHNDHVRQERAHLDKLQQDKDIAKAHQRARAVEARVFQHDTQRAIAASQPTVQQLKIDDERALRQAVLNSINDYTRGLERQLKQGKARVRKRYTRCGHEVMLDAAGFAAEAGVKPDVVVQDALCDDCYIERHREARVPEINVEAPSSSMPGPVRRTTSDEPPRIQRRGLAEQYYEPSESPTQPAHYAKPAPSFISSRHSRSDPHAAPEAVPPLPTIAGSRAPSVARVMQNRANEEATRQRLFEAASEAGSSAMSAASEATFRPTGAAHSAKKAGKQRVR